MKDLMAKLDELHAKATPGAWDYEPRGVSCDPAEDVHTLRANDHNLSTGSKWEGTVLECDAQLITELVNHWPTVRRYIAKLEDELRGHRNGFSASSSEADYAADSMADGDFESYEP